MTNVLIIGATGLVGQKVTKYFLDKTDDYLTLMARNTSILSIDEKRERAVEGDVIDDEPLMEALKGNDVVFVALDSNLEQSTQRILDGMEKLGIKWILFASSMGLYNDVPVSDGASGNLTEDAILKHYQAAAQMVADSGLNYTIIRPGNFDNGQDLNYEVTADGEENKSQDVSIVSVADFVVKLAQDEKLGAKESLGISRREA